MEPSFWTSRWELGAIGFHRSTPSPSLVQNLDRLIPGGAASSVYVPLAGKSLDLVYLHEAGHRVVATELVPMAVDAFFEAWGVTPKRGQAGPFNVAEGERLRFFQGDAFLLTPELAGPVDAIFDRAALVALRPEDRRRYAAALGALLRPTGRMLLESLEHDGSEPPPHSVTAAEVRALYEDAFVIEQLSSVDIASSSPNLLGRGATFVRETVYLLTKR